METSDPTRSSQVLELASEAGHILLENGSGDRNLVTVVK